MSNWTKPYHGVQHSGDFGSRNYWATVCDYEGFAELHCYFPGCGFKPIQSTHDTAEQARAAGDAWLASVNAKEPA